MEQVEVLTRAGMGYSGALASFGIFAALWLFLLTGSLFSFALIPIAPLVTNQIVFWAGKTEIKFDPKN